MEHQTLQLDEVRLLEPEEVQLEANSKSGGRRVKEIFLGPVSNGEGMVHEVLQKRYNDSINNKLQWTPHEND